MSERVRAPALSSCLVALHSLGTTRRSAVAGGASDLTSPHRPYSGYGPGRESPRPRGCRALVAPGNRAGAHHHLRSLDPGPALLVVFLDLEEIQVVESRAFEGTQQVVGTGPRVLPTTPTGVPSGGSASLRRPSKAVSVRRANASLSFWEPGRASGGCLA